jgi:predicted acyl esterase
MDRIYPPIVRPELPPGVKLDANVYVKMRDGIKIAVDVYRPEAEGRYPGIMSTSPYIKDLQLLSPLLTHSIEAGATQLFVSKGYVHVIVQVRVGGPAAMVQRKCGYAWRFLLREESIPYRCQATASS